MKNKFIPSYEFDISSCPILFIPNEAKLPYKNGYFIRYFAKRVGNENKNIIEIDSINYNKLKNSPFYVTVHINWMITGNRNTIVKNKIKEVGIEEHNHIELLNADKKMNGIHKHLSKNLIKYWKGY